MLKIRASLTGVIWDYSHKRTIAQLEIVGNHLEDLMPIKDIELDVDFTKHREKRSLDSNAYAWVLMDKIAKALKTSKEEIYKVMLERYGTFIYLPADDSQIASLKQVFRIVKERGETTLVTPSGKVITCKQVQCYKGSSLMNTKEMSDFLDGVVSEAKELGIATETPDELERMKSLWDTKAS